MKTLYILLFALIVSAIAQAQSKPKSHIIYDTIKNVEAKIVYEPDTIQVYFKELIVGNEITEKWQKGYVIWQTYQSTGASVFLNSPYATGLGSKEYYVNTYNQTESMPGIFLYSDRKTKVKNKVLASIKR